MGRLKVFLRGWSLKRKLILGVTVLTLLVLTPVLSVNFLPASSTGALGDGAGEPQSTEEVSNPGSTAGAGEPQSTEEVSNLGSIVGAGEPQSTEEVSNPSSTEGAGESPTIGAIKFQHGDDDWVRDPASGLAGYVDFIFVDNPEGAVLHRGEQWTGTVLLHMVSHTPDLTEVEINVDPQRSPTRFGRIVNVKSGARSFGGLVAGEFIDFNDLLSYSPSGAFVIKAGESLTLSLTISIPEDFPEEIEKVQLASLGIWSDNRHVRVITAPEFAKTVFVR